MPELPEVRDLPLANAQSSFSAIRASHPSSCLFSLPSPFRSSSAPLSSSRSQTPALDQVFSPARLSVGLARLLPATQTWLVWSRQLCPPLAPPTARGKLSHRSRPRVIYSQD